MERTVFNAAQREILDILSCIRTDEELRELKTLLLKFLNDKLQKELDALWDEGIINENKLEEWRTIHFRTPYK